jgi:UDP-glucuronate decarboxylase
LQELDGPMNLGNPGEFTVQELAELTLELIDSKSKIERRPLPADDPKQRRPDISKAQSLIGFEPAVPLREGLRRTIEDFKQRVGEQSASGDSVRPLASRVVTSA